MRSVKNVCKGFIHLTEWDEHRQSLTFSVMQLAIPLRPLDKNSAKLLSLNKFSHLSKVHMARLTKMFTCNSEILVMRHQFLLDREHKAYELGEVSLHFNFNEFFCNGPCEFYSHVNTHCN